MAIEPTASADITPDGEIYIAGNKPPQPPSQSAAAEAEEREWGTGVGYHVKPDDGGPLYERVLLKTKDPTTLPRTRSVCVKWAKPWPGSKICIGWKLQFKWFWVIATLRVSTAGPVDISKAVEECLKEAAIIAAIAAIVTGGSAAAATAASALQACLYRKLGDALLSVSVSLSHEWSQDWS